MHLERNAHCDPGTVGEPAVVEVVSITGVIDINIVCFILVISPIVRIGVHHREPIAVVLETRIASLIHEGKAEDAE